VTGISIGTELIDYRGAFEKLPEQWKKIHPYTFPVFPGYENVGRVVEVGKDVKDVEVGDRVVHYGYHAEYCVVPRRDALPGYEKLPDSVSDEDATLSILGTTALWAVHRGQIEYGDNVVVLGDGVVGILTALHAQNTGAEKVILVGNHIGKLNIAKQAGVKYTVNHRSDDWKEQIIAETDGLGADIVFECVGSSTEPTKAVAEACEIARQLGKVVIVGDHMAGQPDLILCSDPHFKELTFIVSRATGHGSHHPFLIDALNKVQKYNYVKWTTTGLLKRVVKMIAQGKLNVHPLITHRFKYTEVAEAFRRINEKKEDFVQVLLTDW
jgi:threonine dehydrogenase-like Zn-dependent dehydrogenase